MWIVTVTLTRVGRLYGGISSPVLINPISLKTLGRLFSTGILPPYFVEASHALSNIYTFNIFKIFIENAYVCIYNRILYVCVSWLRLILLAIFSIHALYSNDAFRVVKRPLSIALLRPSNVPRSRFDDDDEHSAAKDAMRGRYDTKSPFTNKYN